MNKSDSNKDKKIERYQKALKLLLDDSVISDHILKNKKEIKLEAEPDSDEDCLIINYAKDISELSKEEYNSVKKQDTYRKYNKVEKYAKKGGVIYGVTNTVIGFASMFWWL